MFTSLIAALLASSVLVLADPNPSTPGPGAVYNSGAQCPIAWAADSTGAWKTMNIQLMTGDNLNMIPLTSVATVDGTSVSSNTFSWTCPEVIPNAAIYFYQFTSPAANNTLWTTRFAIASDTGVTTPAPNATQPDGKAIPWGDGKLANPADAESSPIGVTTTAALNASTSATPTTALSSIAPLSPLTTSPATVTTTGTASATTGTAGSGASSNTATALSADGQIFQAVVALGLAAIAYTTLL